MIWGSFLPPQGLRLKFTLVSRVCLSFPFIMEMQEGQVTLGGGPVSAGGGFNFQFFFGPAVVRVERTGSGPNYYLVLVSGELI